jgi:hypothetical protein
MATGPRHAADAADREQGCPYANDAAGRPLDLDRHRRLHEDGRRLIDSWFARAWVQREDDAATFESFVFAWISVNAWAACVTEEDQDSRYMRKLQADPGLRLRFHQLVEGDAQFRRDVEAFAELLPIFKAQQLRRAGVIALRESDRARVIQSYLDAGVTSYEPQCAEWHWTQGQPIPLDWPHVIAAMYRVRCNLFHGEKAVHSEMDRRIVRAALMTLTGFFRGTNLL